MFNTNRIILMFSILLVLIFTISGCSNSANDIETTESTAAIGQTESSEAANTDESMATEATEVTCNVDVDESNCECETEATESTEATEEVIEEEVEKIMYFTEEDVIAMAKVLYHECRGVPSTMQQACVAWTACNRVDAGYDDTIYGVLTAPHQFAYFDNAPVTDELYDLALDVLTRWNDEKNGVEDVGRVLPSNYLWFHGSGGYNHFKDGYSGNYNIWNYALENPYVD